MKPSSVLLAGIGVAVIFIIAALVIDDWEEPPPQQDRQSGMVQLYQYGEDGDEGVILYSAAVKRGRREYEFLTPCGDHYLLITYGGTEGVRHGR